MCCAIYSWAEGVKFGLLSILPRLLSCKGLKQSMSFKFLRYLRRWRKDGSSPLKKRKCHQLKVDEFPKSPLSYYCLTCKGDDVYFTLEINRPSSSDTKYLPRRNWAGQFLLFDSHSCMFSLCVTYFSEKLKWTH